MVDVEALIAKARAASRTAAEDNWIEVSTLLGGELVGIRFVAISGRAWSALTAERPPREKSASDATYGFNTDAVVESYPAEAIRISGEPVTPDMWKAIFGEIDAPTVKNCGNALWGLNQYSPAARIVNAKKAMAGASEKKQN